MFFNLPYDEDWEEEKPRNEKPKLHCFKCGVQLCHEMDAYWEKYDLWKADYCIYCRLNRKGSKN